MEVRFQRRIDDRLGDLENTLKNVITDTSSKKPNPAPTPVNLLASKKQPTDPGDISSTLAALSLSVDKHMSEERRGNFYRPEYFVQGVDGGCSVKSMDHMKLSHREFIHGMTRVVQNMLRENDPLLPSYIEPMCFVTSLAAEGGFINEPFLKYDRYIIDKAL